MRNEDEGAGALAELTVSLYYMFSVNVTMASIAAALVLQLTFYCVAMRSQTMHQENFWLPRDA
jgi:hypothetical protein